MEAVLIERAHMPDGFDPVLVTSRQAGVDDLPAAFNLRTSQQLTRWRLTDEERQQIAAGGHVYLWVWSRGPYAPVGLSVGP